MLVLAFVSAAGAASPAPRTIVVLGDSLSAGYGIKLQEGWVNLLAQRLAAEGYGYSVINASVSGETTQGGVARLPRVLETHKPAIVIVELGGTTACAGCRWRPAVQICSARSSSPARRARAWCSWGW